MNDAYPDMAYEAAVLAVNDFAARTYGERLTGVVFYENIGKDGRPLAVDRPWEIRNVGLFIGGKYVANIEIEGQDPALFLSDMAKMIAEQGSSV